MSNAVQSTPVGAPPVDFTALKARSLATWSAGDFAVIGSTLQLVGESLAEAADVRSGERVLDVACGNGNAALAAARRFAHVTGIDFVPALLERARARAAADGLALELREADAEALPFPDGAFDVVLSTYGVMFTPDQAKAARELARVTRHGGRIALASWTPDGFIGEVFRAVGRHLPPPPGAQSPARWGTRAGLEALLGAEVRDLRVAERTFPFRYLSARHFLEMFRTWYGPIHKAYGALPPAGQEALTDDLTALLEKYDTGNGNGLVVPGAYLEAVATRV
ncbi:MAG: class I SAM-dependent methyltransferase [Anaeromyxobacter sp.]